MSLWSRPLAQLLSSHVHLCPVQGYDLHFCFFSSTSWLCHSLLNLQYVSISEAVHLIPLITTMTCFEVQGYLEVKGQRNKSSGENTHLVKVNDGYHQEWGSERSQIDRMNQKITITVFLCFLSSPYGLTISPSVYGYNVTWSPM